MAQDVYDALTEKGCRVFFSRISPEDKLGMEYEPCIFAALHSAKIMPAFGTGCEYFNAVRGKNEWSRFLQREDDDLSVAWFCPDRPAAVLPSHGELTEQF